MYLNFFKIILGFLLISLVHACTKDQKPTIGATNRVILTTSSISSIGSDSAISGGTITSDGGDPITERGVCWATSTNPVISPYRTLNGSGTGTFTSVLKPLLPNTTYYIRSYIKNTQGTIYGNQLSFITKASVPIIQTSSVTSITQSSATVGGANINGFGSAITQKGICWSSTNPNPSITNNVVVAGAGTTSFTVSIQNLSPNTSYYARAFATSASGTGYGNSVQFRTLTALIPSISTNSITNIGRNSATSGGNVSSDGGALVTQKGLCWSTSQNPTISNSTTFDGQGLGSFTSNIIGLVAGTTYYVRAYAINSVGTAYGSQFVFTTQPNQLPSITTSSISNISRTSAQGGGNVSSDGGALVTQRGLCWSTFQNPTISNSRTVNGSGTGLFTSAITGLATGTTYYVRAYATNALGTSYGVQTSFRTNF